MVWALAALGYAVVGVLIAAWIDRQNEALPRELQNSPALSGVLWLPFLICGTLLYILHAVYSGFYAKFMRSR